ncbi:MAG: globin [Okeania sp. SIO2F4]|nr:globin domain-containing protein [Okeania sp. SIO2F4]NES05073.1 globin [Okeania sp. SIO2F4]
MFEGAGYSPTEISISPQSTSEISLDKTPVSKPSSQLSVEIIENSFEKIKPYGAEFAASFYENLFLAYPEAQPLFAQTEMSKQQQKLLNSLVLVVENLRHPEALAEVLKSLGARHVNYGALKQHYPLVGEALLTTLEQYLGDNWNIEVKNAWVFAYEQIVELMFEGAGYSPTEISISPQSTSEISLDKTPVSKPSSQLSVEIIENSFEKIKPYGAEFAASFYENLFLAYPEAQPLFAQTEMSKQQQKLLNSLVLVVENLRHPEALAEVLKSLGARHVNYGALKQHYPLVGETLLTTLEQYLGDDWNLEVSKAWVYAIGQITRLMFEGAGYINTTKPAAETAKKTQSESQEKSVSNETPKQKARPPVQQVKQQTKNEYSQAEATVKLQKLLAKIVNLFWGSPKWLVVIIVVILTVTIINIVDEDSFLGKTLDSIDAISVIVVVVLFIKETPDRKKQFHYQAWSIIDAAKGIKDSQARFMAIQDLNEDNISLRSLEAPGAYLANINLKNAHLNEANLSKANLENSNLKRANLSYANLSLDKLPNSNLSYANLSFTNLTNANLSNSKLNYANLVCADLSNTNLSGANLTGANLSGANLKETYLVGANLKDAKVSVYELYNAYLKDAIMPDSSKHE